MSFTSLFPVGGAAGDPFPVDYPAKVSDLNKIAGNFDDHEARITAINPGHAVAASYTLAANTSMVVNRSLSINTGVKVTLLSGARLRVL